jgi:hypothetical protein
MSNIDNQGNDSNSQAAGNPCSSVESAAPHEVEAHRNAVGAMLQNLSDKGIDVEKLAEQAGVSSADITALSHDDIGSLTVYIAKNHPEVLQSVAAKFPDAQGLIGLFAGSGGLSGMLSGLIGSKESGA